MPAFGEMIHSTPALRAAWLEVHDRVAEVARDELAALTEVDPSDPEPMIAGRALAGLLYVAFESRNRHVRNGLRGQALEDAVAADLDRAARLLETGLWSFNLLARGARAKTQALEAAKAADEARAQVLKALRQARSAWRDLRRDRGGRRSESQPIQPARRFPIMRRTCRWGDRAGLCGAAVGGGVRGGRRAGGGGGCRSRARSRRSGPVSPTSRTSPLSGWPRSLPSIHATSHYQPLARTDAVLICVPTPLTANREPDLGPLKSAARALGLVLQRDQLVVLESTTYPGTTRELLVPILEQESDLRVPDDVNVAFSPERVDPGRTDYTLRNTPKVVGGVTEQCGDRAAELYGMICDQIVRVSTPDAAEMTKLLENIFRSVNIALVNELAILAERMGIDIWEVVDAASTKPYGFTRFEPGPGMGGHCLPVDPFYLTWRAREFHMSTEFIELAGKINQQMPYHCVERIEGALNDAAKAINGANIAILGVSYKGGVGDTRESPAAADHGGSRLPRRADPLPRPVRPLTA